MTDLGLRWREMRTSDRNYVLSSWTKSYASRSKDARDYGDRRRDFYDDYAPVVRDLVDRSQVLVACLAENEDVVVGWMALEGDALHYVLVKPRWRRLGVARWMLKDMAALSLMFTHLTSAAMSCPIPTEWAYRRFRIWPPQEKAA